MITSAYSKSSNSSGFNPILQKLYQTICDIIVSKMVFEISLFFCQSSFINNFMEKTNFLEPQNHRKLNISTPLYFKKISTLRFEDRIYTNKLDRFFFKKYFFQGLGTFFTTKKPLTWMSFFFHQNLILYFFTKMII